MTGELQQIVGSIVIAEHRGPADAKSFAKGDHQQFRFDLLLPAAATPLLAQHPNPVRVIHHQPAAGLPCQLMQLRQRSGIAVHAEYPFGHHQRFRCAVAGQQFLQAGGLIVAETTQGCRTKARGFQQ